MPTSLSPRARKWITLAVVIGLSSIAPLLILFGQSAMQRQAARRALVFDAPAWRADAGRLDPESDRGLMVPGLVATGQLAGMAEPDVRSLLGEPDCPPVEGGPFAADVRLAYWVGRVGTARVKAGDPAAGPGCFYLRVVDGRVVEWQLAAAPDTEASRVR